MLDLVMGLMAEHCPVVLIHFPCFPCNPNVAAVKSRSLMTVACVATLNMSLMTTAGICSAMGWFLTPLAGALPFILLGIAVDDAFVIVT